jgi:lipopolysaccharide/colanic/teichoic acid biosynthesis glycosyltransferase
LGTALSMPEPSSNTELSTDHARALYLLSFAQPNAARNRTAYTIAKRIIDAVLSAVLLVVLSPLMLVIAIVVKMTSDGPAILAQERVGQGGRVFYFFKFRSMYNNLDQSADRRFAQAYVNGQSTPPTPGDGVFKPAGNRRVTAVGRILRKTSLDELPQLFNVLRGDMSLVGPRPSMPYEVDVYKPWHFRRLEVLPGITGLAQIRGRSSLSFRDIVEIDLAYIESRTILLDLTILLKTVPVWLSGRGAR